MNVTKTEKRDSVQRTVQSQCGRSSSWRKFLPRTGQTVWFFSLCGKAEPLHVIGFFL